MEDKSGLTAMMPSHLGRPLLPGVTTSSGTHSCYTRCRHSEILKVVQPHKYIRTLSHFTPTVSITVKYKESLKIEHKHIRKYFYQRLKLLPTFFEHGKRSKQIRGKEKMKQTFCEHGKRSKKSTLKQMMMAKSL
jgi:hypothetical protein